VSAHRVFGLLLVCVLIGMSGCASRQPEEPAAEAKSPTLGVVGEMEVPELAYAEWRLADNAMLQDYDERFAVLFDNNFDGVGGMRIRLLDMETGTHRVVVPDTMGRAEGFTMTGLHCSDEWVIWEELRGDEQNDPLDVEWRLWAAPIDAGGASVGTPSLIRKSVVSIRSRPLFQADGHMVHVMSNTFPNAKQEGATYRSSIVSIDLDSGTEREIYTSDRMLRAFSVREDELTVAEYVDYETERSRIRVIGLAEGIERLVYEPSGAALSHWPVYREGTLLWARDDGANDPWPSLWCMTSDGTLFKLAEDGLDPVAAGPYVFYRDYPDTRSAAIVGLETATMRTFELLRTSIGTDRYWQPMIDGRTDEHALVVWRQVFAADVGPDLGGTYVRRYYIQ